MEAAAAAIPEAGPEEDDQLDAMTVAEPEMEVDVQGSDPEPEHADDIPDLDEYPEEVNDNSNETSGRSAIWSYPNAGAKTPDCANCNAAHRLP